jgi:hypothetical protein
MTLKANSTGNDIKNKAKENLTSICNRRPLFTLAGRCSAAARHTRLPLILQKAHNPGVKPGIMH